MNRQMGDSFLRLYREKMPIPIRYIVGILRRPWLYPQFIYNLAFRTKRHRGQFSNPVLIYQMGKVASSSIFHSLKTTTDFNAFHVHRLNPKHITRVREGHLQRGDSPPIEDEEGLYLYENLIKPCRTPIKIISLVREPISRNISAFFQNLQSYERLKNPHVRHGHYNISTNRLNHL